MKYIVITIIIMHNLGIKTMSSLKQLL